MTWWLLIWVNPDQCEAKKQTQTKKNKYVYGPLIFGHPLRNIKFLGPLDMAHQYWDGPLTQTMYGPKRKNQKTTKKTTNKKCGN